MLHVAVVRSLLTAALTFSLSVLLPAAAHAQTAAPETPAPAGAGSPQTPVEKTGDATAPTPVATSATPAPAPTPPPVPVANPGARAAARADDPVKLTWQVGAGAYSFVGDSAGGLDVGLQGSFMVGFKLNRSFSLNSQITGEVLNFKQSAVNSGTPEPSGSLLTLSLVPLFYLPVGDVEIAVGPRLGRWRLGASSAGVNATEVTSNGMLLGGSLGMFVTNSSDLRAGVVVTYESRFFSESCQTDSGGSEDCTEAGLGGPLRTLVVSAAIGM